jgi:UDP-N-acetylmuramoyl-L-alanyl-D-glutamate--2,6-diaminopimelate ligase
MKNLKNLLDGNKLKSDIQFKNLCINSNDIDPGDVFVALKNSSKRDGNKYIDHAFNNGAVAVLSGINHANDNRNIFHVSGLEEKLVDLANKAYEFNQVKKIFGITGTNGKTSTIHFLKQLHEQLNMKVSFFNSIENGGSGLELLSSKMTTPDIFKLYRFLEISNEHNIENSLLEVSSHAIHQKRIGDIAIKFKGLTSFSEDHLDYHGNMEKYSDVKESFFDSDDLSLEGYVFNEDNYLGSKLKQKYKNSYSYSFRNKDADVFIHKSSSNKFLLDSEDILPKKINVNFQGDHYFSNLICALLLFKVANQDVDLSSIDIFDLCLPEGRNQKVDFDGKDVFIDFAHTPDALNASLKSLRSTHSGNLICLFGCGGDRDRSKRSKMGKIAENLSDQVFVTNDNPRSEDPKIIVEDILSECSSKNINVIFDRKEAILESLESLVNSKPGSALLIAGKGNENYQEFENGLRKEFSDYEVVMSFKNAI